MKLRQIAITLAAALVFPCAYGADATAAVETPYIPYGNLEKAKPEDIERAKKIGESMASDLMNAYRTQSVPQVQEYAQKLKRRADDIADEAIAAERDSAMEFLGLNPRADSALYVFVSWSMPLELLRAYAIEAMWSGATLVVKGVPPGKTLGKFITEDLQGLVYGKGGAANISIDPRLFDSYGVTVVPTVVFSTVRTNMSCQGVNPVSFKSDKTELSYDTCPPLDPSKYHRISGAVTTNFALQTFIDDGAEEAKPHLAALAKGWANGTVPDKGQKPFVGKWESVLSPADKRATQNVTDTVTRPAGTNTTP